jgi:hypothetical protein
LRSLRQGVRYLAFATAALFLLSAILAAFRQPVLDAMYGVTGEEDTLEEIKGVTALALLNLTRHPLQTADLTPVAHTGVNPYGINTFLEQEVEPQKVERALQMIADAGFHWVRQEFPWEDIEIHGRGDFEDRRNDPPRSAWDKYDRIVDLAGKYGLQLIVRLDHPPAWTRVDGNARGAFAPPDNLQDYANFVSAVVSRYRGRVRYYQIWNEPNIYPEWGEQAVDPEGYVRLLRAAYQAAKAADPDCVVLAAGLAQTLESGGRNMNDLVYLQRMYDAGVRGCFDIMGVMAYGLWTGPQDRRTSADRTNFSRPQLVRDIMVRNGDADKPIWATEVGWNSVPADFAGAAIYGRVTEEKQAQYAVEAYRRAQVEWPWMGVLNYWFFKRATDTETGQVFYYFRMVEPDFSPLPVYGAMSALTHETPVVGVGYHQEDDWALRYSGGWAPVSDPEAVLGAAVSAASSGNVEFTFQGTDLDLVIRKGPVGGSLSVQVDGRTVQIDATSDQETWGFVAAVVRALRPGAHRVVIEARDGATLDGIIVQRRTWAWVGRTALPALVVIGLAAALAWQALWARRAAP